MSTSLSSKDRARPLAKGPEQPKWKRFFGRTIVLVLAVSLAIHLLFLLAFGSVAIFKGNLPKLPFVSQQIAAETAPEVPPPPTEDAQPPEEMVQQDPFAAEAPEQSAAEESAPALEMLTVVGGVNWAPAIPKKCPGFRDGGDRWHGQRHGYGYRHGHRQGGGERGPANNCLA